MTEEIITLSQTELDRASVMQSIINRHLTQAQAARAMSGQRYWLLRSPTGTIDYQNTLYRFWTDLCP